MKYLLARKAVVDATTHQGSSALLEAASAGHEPCVRALLEARAHVDLHRKGGWTALLVCAAVSLFWLVWGVCVLA